MTKSKRLTKAQQKAAADLKEIWEALERLKDRLTDLERVTYGDNK